MELMERRGRMERIKEDKERRGKGLEDWKIGSIESKKEVGRMKDDF